MKTLTQICFASVLAAPTVHADLIVSTTGPGRAVMVQHCDAAARPVCTRVDAISSHQFKTISRRVTWMCRRRLITMGATLRAMPFVNADLFDDYRNYREVADALSRLTDAKSGGAMRIVAALPGSDRIVGLFERAITEAQTQPTTN